MISVETEIELSNRLSPFNQIKIKHRLHLMVNYPGGKPEVDIISFGLKNQEELKDECLDADGKMNVSKLQRICSRLAEREFKQIKKAMDELDPKYLFSAHAEEGEE